MKPQSAHSPTFVVKAGHRKVKVVAPPASPRRGWWRRFRLALIAIQVVAAVALIEHFLIRPRRLAPARQPTPTLPVAVKPPPLKGLPAPALGARALLPARLRAVEPALLPDTAELAAGSAEAQAAQVAFSLRSGLPLEVENSLGIRFRLVPPGSGLVGSPPEEAGRTSWESRHRAWFNRPFYLSVSEITQEQWLKIMPENPSYFRETRRPVEEVSWHQCVEFARELGGREGLPANTYRLPTEREWEYACRAGTATPFFFGSDPRRLRLYADFKENNNHHTNIVMLRRPNAWGFHDLLGNVWEWCLDRFQPYDGGAEAAPVGAELDDPAVSRVLRGGNWLAEASDCRAACRSRLPPASHGNMLGFRLLRTLPEYEPTGREMATPPEWLRPEGAEPPPPAVPGL
ncbi:MAG: SUMF1/EgtB/PvdO family nonheme iron enzyme [Lentisphaeria bacterium]|jgi:formylglycine-generating enzyme required for sulfatase activity